MRHFFTLDGKSSADFGCYIANGTVWNGAEHDDEKVSVPGRDGDLVFSNGRYHNVSGTLSCYIPENMRVNVDALRSFLSTKHKYVRYEDSLHPEEFRMARFVGGFTLDQSDRVGASMDLSFDMKPQRWLKSGEIKVVYNSAGAIYNSTEYTAKPLIICTGQSGTITINGVRVSVTGCSSYVELDCEMMESYEGTTSRNGTTTLQDGAFPVLAPGSNAISFTGFSSVTIVPRWWHI